MLHDAFATCNSNRIELALPSSVVDQPFSSSIMARFLGPQRLHRQPPARPLPSTYVVYLSKIVQV